MKIPGELRTSLRGSSRLEVCIQQAFWCLFSFLSPSQAEGSVSWDSRHHEGVAPPTGLFLVCCVCGTVSNMIEILATERMAQGGKSQSHEIYGRPLIRS